MSRKHVLTAISGVAALMWSLPVGASVVLTDDFATWESDLNGPAFVVNTSSLGTDSTISNTQVSSVSLNGGASVALSKPALILTVPTTWATWSHGYTGQVLYPITTSFTLTPHGTYALGFEVEPIQFASYNVTVSLTNGQSITDSVNGNGGAQFFGYVGAGVRSVTISSPNAPNGFAVGDFFTPSGAAIVNNAVTPYVGTPSGTPSANGLAMFANFTPNGGLSLAQAAAAMGYAGFDWQQTITNWANPDLHDNSGVLLVPVPPDQPFLDPPAGGYSYNPCGVSAPFSTGAQTANPFYYSPTAYPNDCFTVARHVSGNTLNFGDEPMDHQLTATQIANGNIPMLTTDLVGYTNPSPGVYVPGPSLFEWTWNTTYNGSIGSASRSANLPGQPLDPCDTCSGHVTITSINGVPVPEPSPFIPFASGVLAMLGFGWKVARSRDG
jgi:hypothetical protein